MVIIIPIFDFKVIFKPGWVHFLPNQLSIINHGESAIRVKDQLHDAQLFGIEINWYGQIIYYSKKLLQRQYAQKGTELISD
jgi:hypothetical protein